MGMHVHPCIIRESSIRLPSMCVFLEGSIISLLDSELRTICVALRDVACCTCTLVIKL